MTAWKKKRQTIKHYDSSAHVYNIQYSQEQQTKIKPALTQLPLRKHSLILDAGCGTGLLFPHIANKVKQIVGIDTSNRILKQGKKIQAHRVTNIALVRADIDYTPFLNESFDAAFAITLLQNTPNPAQTLAEIKRVTKPNAIIIATGLKKAFSEQEFTELLSKAKLTIKSLKLDEHSKEYIAVCMKKPQENLKKNQ